MARAALPLRTRLDSASAIAPAVGRRYRPMNSELWQQEHDRWLLAHLLAAPSRSTRHRQGEWSRAARTSGGRACVGRTNRTTRSSAPLHAGRRAERVLPLPAGGRKKCARLENLRVAPRVKLERATERTLKKRVSAFHSRLFMPVAHGRSESPTTSAVVEGGQVNILWLFLALSSVQQAFIW